MKKILAASSTLAVLVLGVSTAGAQPQSQPRAGCSKLFTVAMGHRAAQAIYRGDRHVTLRNLRLLGYIERCQVNASEQPAVRTYDRQLDALHRDRVAPPVDYAVASWYEDGGSTACGFHAGMGVANKSLPCGTEVMFYYDGREAEATVDDRGPYVGDRYWDLNQTTAGALEFAGVQTVGYRLLSGN